MTPYIWLGIIVVGVIIETASPQLVSIWFVLGAVVALVANLLGANEILQIAIALAVSIAALILTKPLVKKILSQKAVSTNADRNIGKVAVVTTEIADGVGIVKVQGASWSAFCKTGETFPVGSKVIVEAIEGVKLVVKKMEV